MDAEEAAAPAEHLDLVAEFCSITDAGPDVAASLLAAADYQLDAAVDLFFNDPGAVQPLPPAAALLHPPPAAAAAAAQQQHDYVEILDDDDDEDDAGLAELARQRQRALAARQQAEDAMDDELAVVGTAAGRPPSQAAAAGASAPGAAAPMDLADDDMAAVAAAVAADGGQDQHADFASYHRRQQEELMSMYQRQAARQQAAALQPASATAGGASSDGGGGGDAAGEGGAGVAAGAGAAGGFPDDEPLDLPAGINLEEARMLEAAMLGVPYAGRIPDFTAAAPAQPLSPGTLEQHAIRREQDQAYEESLALDRAKQESIEAAAAEAEAAERAQQEAEAAAAAEAASAAQTLSQLLASKKARLPPEPSGAGSVQVVVRLPSGSRKGRRFLPSDPLQAVFDYVDVECAAVGPEAEASGSGSCRECMARLPQGAALHQRVWSPGKDAGLGEDVVAWLVGATTSCESCNSSSSSTRREPCVCVTSEQLCDGSTAFGVQWVKQRLNPHGQKRAANGVKVPRVFNWSANAPTQLQQPEVLWGLLDGNSSSASASGAAATTSSSSGSHPQLLTIRSKAPGAIAFALACHDSSQCKACAASDAPAAAQSGSLAPDASYWNSSITCHKMALGLKHHTLLLYDRVFVSVCSSNEEAGVPAGQPVAANNSKRAKQPRS